MGTQALREAGNASLFKEPAETLLGTAIETIPGEREAQLVHRAVAADALIRLKETDREIP